MGRSALPQIFYDELIFAKQEVRVEDYQISGLHLALIRLPTQHNLSVTYSLVLFLGNTSSLSGQPEKYFQSSSVYG
jgi:hypothetical protein